MTLIYLWIVINLLACVVKEQRRYYVKLYNSTMNVIAKNVNISIYGQP